MVEKSIWISEKVEKDNTDVKVVDILSFFKSIGIDGSTFTDLCKKLVKKE